MAATKSKSARPPRWKSGLLAALACLPLFSAASARAETLSEYQVKAAFLFNFAKFVKWPENAPSEAATSFDVCVLGDDLVTPTIAETIGGKTLRSKQIVVRHLAFATDADKSCHVLFVTDGKGSEPRRVLRGLEGVSVLTVGESEHFAEGGGIINFRMEDNKVRFEINVDAAKRANLEISSQLLKLATIVHERTNRE
jgi:hypothetical protein